MRIVGVMSGTSVDGIDVAVADIDGDPAKSSSELPPGLQLQQIAFETIPWSSGDRALIFDLFEDRRSIAELCRANFVLAERFADAVVTVLEESRIPLTEVDLIGCHGQTIWHDVDATGAVTSTLQIGDPSLIAARTGITTVANFRTADVAVGGQGAPLTSTFDWLLMRPPAKLNGVVGGWRAVQNIGGLANVTLLPPIDSEAVPIAFDTGPGNALIDWAVGVVTNGQHHFDQDGLIAASGRVAYPLLEEWMTLPYFEQPLPKSTGRELFSSVLGEQWRISAFDAGLSDADFVATVTELTALSIADAYHRYAPGPIGEVVVGGGGARNPTLMARLRYHLGADVALCTHEELGIDSDAKEALAFALLAYLAILGKPGNIPSCTGARSEQILGQIAPGANWGQLLAMDN